MLEQILNWENWSIMLQFYFLPRFWIFYLVIGYFLWNGLQGEKQQEHFDRIKEKYGWY